MRQPRGPDVIIFPISGRVARPDIPSLCTRLGALLESRAGDPVICDVGELVQVDVTTVDALARLQLTARRRGRRLWLCRASQELVDLLALLGLSEVVTIETASSLRAQGQPEEREELGGVEEEADPGDPTV